MMKIMILITIISAILMFAVIWILVMLSDMFER
jgi:hypothetical protein